ncbi:hypothetical protein GN244_ATG17060 [Phytophthora infestans]|uniref:Uncharacterized protein n=1 Tax=Phytophthora infestans TaxID=4787 RepID=A0A833SS57_PHYIN|nr:hypothetical protein GN244_ATG17060 [Phytophthora infestans]KAF4130337.1 hypothetical protein GN958_ATG20461 [Phytophthora infestans]KAF4135854.1 hypothetical protein GN958_ATG14955 [Phytophthora infestans]
MTITTKWDNIFNSETTPTKTSSTDDGETACAKTRSSTASSNTSLPLRKDKVYPRLRAQN